MSERLWLPSAERIKHTEMTAFTNWLSQKTGRTFRDYSSLHKWSVENLEQFWGSFLEYTGIIQSEPHYQILDTHEMPGSKWFSGMKLNFSENILNRNFDGHAIIYQIEHSQEAEDVSDSHFGEVSFEELRSAVARCARGLREAGVQSGDRVGGYMANVPAAVIACLACASLGATWSSASPDFGLNALCDRFKQVEPKLIFASTHYKYGGKIFRTDEVIKQVHDRIPSVKEIVSVPYPIGVANILGDIVWDDFLGPADNPALTFTQLPFDHPLYILFSSGTTGKPKCMVHAAGGTLLQHRKELAFHCDIGPEDFLLFFTTCGWMMWNWQLSALSLGATIGLYDGNPGYPNLSAIWNTVDKIGITHFGTSGRFIESCMKSQPPITAGELGELSSLSTILYTGSPLSPKGFRWIYDTVKKNVHLAGISGGTDIVSCFILGNPNLPVHAGEIQCKGLGVDVTAHDSEGNSVSNEPGELVCRKPLPCMPIEFLNDPDGQRYRDAYFDVYPGVWRHGDYVEFTETGGVIIYGRSDATLNPGGVRIGSAEIYAALETIRDISGSVAVGWTSPGQSDEIVVLFVVLRTGKELDENFEKKIKQAIRETCSPRHVPHHIFQISAVPVTRSGKTVELSVKAVLAGKAVSNRNALANPHVLDEVEEVRKRLVTLYS